MLVTGGVLWPYAQLAKEEQITLEKARGHKYSVGDTLESDNTVTEIMYLSPTLDCDNNWIYFCKSSSSDLSGKAYYRYSIMFESAE